MQKTLKQLAEHVGGTVEGDAGTVITGVCSIKTADTGDITFAAKIRYETLVADTKASAVVVRKECPVRGARVPLLRVDNPAGAFEKIADLFAPETQRFYPGIHPTAVIAKGASVDKTAHIGALCVVEENSVIGPHTVLYPQVYIGRSVTVGGGCKIYPHAAVLERCRVGDRVILHSGVVVGSDGFGYKRINGKPEKIPQPGRVEIEDDVELGANTTIDRARFGRTIVRKHAKLDNLVHIAHNCSVGEGTAISALVGISGSVDIGKNVLFGGQAGSKDNLSIGDNAIITARAGLTKNVRPGAIVYSFPAMEQDKFMRLTKLQMKLPQLYETVEKLEKKLLELDGSSTKNDKEGR